MLLVGASGGIGHAILDRLVLDEDVAHIYATSRSPACSLDAKVTWLELDYWRPETVSAAVAALEQDEGPLDAFVCASGNLHGLTGQPEKAVAQLQLLGMESSYRVNAAGPLDLYARCAPLLKSASQPVALFLSAQVGSIEDNELGGWFSYRMAKAALNMGVKTAAIEAARWRNQAAVVAVHPGTTVSGLSRPFIARRKAPVRPAQETAERLHKLMGRLGPEDNGTFVTGDGSRLPW